MLTRLQLRQMGEEQEDMIIYSFWPDVIMVKEIGDPLQVAEYLQLDNEELRARVILAQGRQNTNYAINLYACHPFFIQGIASMTNGENTAFVPIREFLMSRGFPGYVGISPTPRFSLISPTIWLTAWGWGSRPTSISSRLFRIE